MLQIFRTTLFIELLVWSSFPNSCPRPTLYSYKTNLVVDNNRSNAFKRQNYQDCILRNFLLGMTIRALYLLSGKKKNFTPFCLKKQLVQQPFFFCQSWTSVTSHANVLGGLSRVPSHERLVKGGAATSVRWSFAFAQRKQGALTHCYAPSQLYVVKEGKIDTRGSHLE